MNAWLVVISMADWDRIWNRQQIDWGSAGTGRWVDTNGSTPHNQSNTSNQSNHTGLSQLTHGHRSCNYSHFGHKPGFSKLDCGSLTYPCPFSLFTSGEKCHVQIATDDLVLFTLAIFKSYHISVKYWRFDDHYLSTWRCHSSGVP